MLRESRARESHLSKGSDQSDGNGRHSEEVSHLHRLPLPPQDLGKLGAWKLAVAGGGDDDQDKRASGFSS